MKPIDILESSWQSLTLHRLRSGLSILGILIGIASFSIMYSVGETARAKTIKAIKELGGDIIMVAPKTKSMEAQVSRNMVLTFEDVSNIKRDCPSVSKVASEISGTTDFFHGGISESINVLGILPAYLEMFKIKEGRGRLINEVDIDSEHQVCLVGFELAKRLFKDRDQLGQPLKIKGYQFQIIGILKDYGQGGLVSVNSSILIPFNFARRLIDKDISALYVLAHDTNRATSELRRYFLVRHPDDLGFEIRSQKHLLQTQEASAKIFQYILWAISSISLVVGGIGIMNIMLVSVTERLREIGIRRALGATKTEIKLQFLCESVLLCFVGAFAGTALGYLGARVVSYSLQFSPIFSVKLLLLALAIASLLGIICGTYPAARAASQDPTIVLRYE
jgi:putative ABC transport system permease protein